MELLEVSAQILGDVKGTSKQKRETFQKSHIQYLIWKNGLKKAIYLTGENTMSKSISLLDIMTLEMAKRADEIAYEFLHLQGFDVLNAETDAKVRERLADELKLKAMVLTYKCAVNNETGEILFWYELMQPNKDNNLVKIATSSGIKFVPKEIELIQEPIESFEMTIPIKEGDSGE